MTRITKTRQFVTAACVLLAVAFIGASVWFGLRAPNGAEIDASLTASTTVASAADAAKPPPIGDSETTSTIPTSEQPGEAQRARREQAFVLMGRGDFVKASEQFSVYVAQRPQDLEAARAYAQALWQQGKAEEAASVLRSVLQQDVRDGTSMYQLALIERGRGNAAEAVKLLQRAFSLEDADPAWRVELARTLKAAGDLKSSRMVWETVLASFDSSDPGRAGALYEYGLVCLSLSDMPAARSAFEQGLRLRPDDANLKKQLQLLADSGSAAPTQGTLTQ